MVVASPSLSASVCLVCQVFSTICPSWVDRRSGFDSAAMGHEGDLWDQCCQAERDREQLFPRVVLLVWTLIGRWGDQT